MLRIEKATIRASCGVKLLDKQNTKKPIDILNLKETVHRQAQNTCGATMRAHINEK